MEEEHDEALDDNTAPLIIYLVVGIVVVVGFGILLFRKYS